MTKQAKTKSYKELKAKRKTGLIDWMFREVVRICLFENRSPNEEETDAISRGLLTRLQNLHVAMTAEEAKAMVLSRLPRLIERATRAIDAQKALLQTEQRELDHQQQERLKQAKLMAVLRGGEDALIKTFARQNGKDRVQALRELQSLGFCFSDKSIKRQFQIKASIERQELNRKKNRKRKRLESTSAFQRDDQDDTFFFIAGYTSGGAPYGVTWEQMGLEPFEDID